MLAEFTLAVIASEGGNGGLLDVNPGLMIWTVVTFIVLLFILKKVAWKPILSALDKRENDIKEALEQAEKAKDEAKKISFPFSHRHDGCVFTGCLCPFPDPSSPTRTSSGIRGASFAMRKRSSLRYAIS